ncbi:MAG: LysM peptidoglycan-binding domain-containing protein [Deltaproteobacteria bacterium]|nr:LysM peptidoglycan-binding domain-containing protein [Deltaproteobacteria bacterium]
MRDYIMGEEITPTPVVIVVTATATPTATPTPIPTFTPVPPVQCAVRTDWPVYTIVRGDTLYSISRRTGTTVDALMTANCLTSTIIFSGQALRVPTLPSGQPVDCGGAQWFFTFRPGQSAVGCPNPVADRQRRRRGLRGRARVLVLAAAG